MQNIGDRLTEARKRLGVALREASEATKIRTDYLAAMENGTFDFSLPEVYKRGFLKIYARYLKLDAEKLSSDFTAQFSGGDSGARREGHENLGRVDAPGGISQGKSASVEGFAADQTAKAQNQAAMVRLGVIIVIAVLVIVFLIMGFQRLLQSSTTPETATTTGAVSSNTTSPTTPIANATLPPANATVATVSGTMKFVFAATNDVTLQVWQVSDSRQIFNNALKKDKPQTITANGPVEVLASQTQYLSISVNGAPPQIITNPADGKRVTGAQAFIFPPK